MKIELEITSNGIVEGSDKRDLIKVFPELEKRFEQRKSYDEYHFNNGGMGSEPTVELDMDKIESMISKLITFEIRGKTLYIKF